MLLIARVTFTGNAGRVARLIVLLRLTKRAQFPFWSWLPAAIAAPTPVRALVHSSTLVTAGIYILLRFAGFSLAWLVVVGRITVLAAGGSAWYEADLKKVVALSTLSQLGVMFVALGVGAKELCFFHLLAHALFKSLLFLSVGVRLHRMFGSQDSRSFGSGLTLTAPASAAATIALFALSGFPFLAGFYRKDAIIERFYQSARRILSGGCFLLGVGLTAAYRFKLLRATCSVPLNSPLLIATGSNPLVKGTLGALGVGAVTGGRFLSPIVRLRPPCTYVRDMLIPLRVASVGLVVSRVAYGYPRASLASLGWLTPLTRR